MRPLRAFVSLQGTSLSDEEKRLFSEKPPFGTILFTHNLGDISAIKSLTDQLRSVCPGIRIAIDQEGGKRATRLGSDIMGCELRSAADFRRLEKLSGIPIAAAAARLQGRIIGETLLSLGIDFNFAPVCDLFVPSSPNFISERCYGDRSDVIVSIAGSFASGLYKRGITPVYKHFPGHGFVKHDPHLDVSYVDPSADFEKEDETFLQLSRIGWLMISHVIRGDIDPDNPSSISEKVISKAREIFVNNPKEKEIILISDSLEMKGLADLSLKERVQKSIAAGMDFALYRTDSFDENREILDSVPEVDESLMRRVRILSADFKGRKRPEDIRYLFERMSGIFEKYEIC